MAQFIAVIMAGGEGKRFWPLSTREKPKQFLDLEQNGRSLLQATWDRLLSLTGGPKHIIVATRSEYVPLVEEQLPTLPSANLLVEPVGRDSGPAVAYASLHVQEQFGNATIGLFPSDHKIEDVAAFESAVLKAKRLAESTDGLVTIGIEPTRAATGYGYIERGESKVFGFAVNSFIEKPNLLKATEYSQSGRHFWNAGMFIWQSNAILRELREHAPQIVKPLEDALAAGRIDEEFHALPSISIDYAVMEKTQRAYVVPGDFGWDDIGDWIALERHWKQGKNTNNTVIGSHCHVDQESAGNLVYAENASDVIVTLGIKNLIIVRRGNALLLVHRDKVQEIKNVLDDARLQNVEIM